MSLQPAQIAQCWHYSGRFAILEFPFWLIGDSWGDASCDRLHQFVSSDVWEATHLEAVLLTEADAQIGGDDARLIIDDMSLRKKGTHSLAAARPYASRLGKRSNYQTLVSLTLTRQEVPMVIDPRLAFA